MGTKTTGSLLFAQAAGKQIIAQGTGGSIDLMVPILAHRVNFPQLQVAYNIWKGAISRLAHSLAAEWVRYGSIWHSREYRQPGLYGHNSRSQRWGRGMQKHMDE
ncbi:hypothetical protein PM082_007419 [Marasmius tenuissimus]|nr:hypothetical protein PM082_007419 [Marasmius tenuissimus]